MDIVVALYAVGIMISLLYPIILLWTSIAVLAVIVGIYTIFRRLSVTVIDDATQAHCCDCDRLLVAVKILDRRKI